MTIFFAITAIFILPDFPATSTWLSPLERRLAEKRLEEDVGVSDTEQSETGHHGSGLAMAFSDWKVWWLALALTSMVVSLSFNAFFPTLSATMGFNTTVTLLLCAPPWIFATLMTFIVTRCLLLPSQLSLPASHGRYHCTGTRTAPGNGSITSSVRSWWVS